MLQALTAGSAPARPAVAPSSAPRPAVPPDAPAAPADAPVRLYRPADRAAVREIALATAFFGRSAAAFCEPRELLADLLTAYYTDVEPDAACVAEAGGRVVGYLLLATDPARVRRYWRRRTPGLVARLAAALPAAPRLRRFLLALLRDRAAGDLAPPAGLEREYPAHQHQNVLAEWRGRGLGARLLVAGLDELRRRGVPGLYARHVLLGADSANLRLKLRHGFRVLLERPARCWAPFTGRPARLVWLGCRLGER